MAIAIGALVDDAIIDVENICDEANETTPEDAFINTILWTYPPPEGCAEEEIPQQFNIYYVFGFCSTMIE